MNASLTDLYALQQVDSTLMAANRRFRALDQGLAEKAAAETAIELHERLSRTFHETTGDLRDAELEVAPRSRRSARGPEEQSYTAGRCRLRKSFRACSRR